MLIFVKLFVSPIKSSKPILFACAFASTVVHAPVKPKPNMGAIGPSTNRNLIFLLTVDKNHSNKSALLFVFVLVLKVTLITF